MLTVEESVFLKVDNGGLRYGEDWDVDTVGHLTRIRFDGVQTIEHLFDRWRRQYAHDAADPAYQMQGEDPFPRLITGVYDQIDWDQRANYYMRPMIAPPATNNTRSVQLQTVNISTNVDFQRWLTDTTGHLATPRLLRFILHRSNRNANAFPPIPNSPALLPVIGAQHPITYLPELNLHEWEERKNPCLPFAVYTGTGREPDDD